MSHLWKAIVAVGAVALVLAIIVGEAIVLTRWQKTAMRYQEVMRRRDQMAARLSPIPIQTSFEHGLDTNLVEAAAFAWLAKQALEGHAGNLPAVTGAKGTRVLGAIYPA